MIDHSTTIFAGKKIGCVARATIVCRTIQAAMQYKTAFNAYLGGTKSP